MTVSSNNNAFLTTGGRADKEGNRADKKGSRADKEGSRADKGRRDYHERADSGEEAES